jgi:hypothetical protein
LTCAGDGAWNVRLNHRATGGRKPVSTLWARFGAALPLVRLALVFRFLAMAAIRVNDLNHQGRRSNECRIANIE